MHFNKKILEANSGDPDQTPHSVVSDLGLHGLPLPYNMDARLIWVKPSKEFFRVYSALIHRIR